MLLNYITSATPNSFLSRQKTHYQVNTTNVNITVAIEEKLEL